MLDQNTVFKYKTGRKREKTKKITIKRFKDGSIVEIRTNAEVYYGAQTTSKVTRYILG